MAFKDENPGYELKTEEAARNWVIEQTEQLEEKRYDCNVVFPGDEGKTAQWQIKAYRKYLVSHGSVLGSLMALHRAGLLSDFAYNELRERAMSTLVPTVVGAKTQ